MHAITIKSSIATIQQGTIKADGRFWLTNTDIHFAPFNAQFGLGPYMFAQREIVKVSKCTGKVAGILPYTRDAIEIILKDGNKYQFIVSNADEWIKLLTHSA
ncbi:MULTISPECIES: hypothetical protein [Pseudoalteromonas]|jgi:hypothetical protein|uniref:GRAM domain-containing protein n=1 Tax=Pseudoalteromonas lipolytica TaxID=570156 RepID=A0AAD0WE39_9GAMM|nr:MULTISPECIES: hypothetical protein [Pseudoalteromonas]AXV67075.1 hypothetical protein D0907_17270 [Pseudoalteromonas donghaensis]EWH05106.1 hypothetical protein AT00_12390 [Pseudoalteromonas lipolytica SCSIO 04301]MAE02001.1 hypothetical protein [Pseudoalteromonas sp.]MBE0353180.1 hypothetical protein [Pseudoalteromonas lipolytica LMEB 39]MCC9661917.1 hypothetical protein [Pseudoalteromonas sp. MB41]|tara:strand:- start:1961 stop:2266 length:306 start_codon:yes stop_codon:yes gene_type:complete